MVASADATYGLGTTVGVWVAAGAAGDACAVGSGMSA